MNGVDYSQKYQRQNEIYRKNLDNAKRNYDEQIDNLKQTHDSRVKSQATAHKKQTENLEKDFQSNVERITEDQRKALVDKNYEYEKSLLSEKERAHAERKDNLQTWNKKFDEMKGTFEKNLSDTKESDQNLRTQIDKNYRENIDNIRKTASSDLNDYITNTSKEKKESDIQFRMEKNALVNDHEREMKDLVARESEKRNALFNDGIREVRELHQKEDKNYIANKNRAEENFQKQIQYTDDKVANEIETRAEAVRERQAIDNERRNKDFSEKYQDLAKSYDKDVREMNYRNRADKISQSEVNKAIRKKYESSQEQQYEQKLDTHLKERRLVEKKFQEHQQATVDSYQHSMRENNIEVGEKVSKIQAEMTESNRQQKYLDTLEKEQLIHTNNLALKYEKDKGTESLADLQRQTRNKVRNLKSSFNTSLENAREKSRKNFEETKAEMLQDKRTLEQRLHEQNSKQSAYIKEVYSDKLEKTIDGYEKRIDSLELQNQLIVQNSNDMIRDIKRKTAAEIERQKKISKDAINTEIKTQKQIQNEKETALLEKIDRLQSDFTKKMNEETLRGRKKLKDVQFELNQKMASEATRYQDIIDQNNKFFARELQRLQMAKSTERERLVQQYEERIEQLQDVYRAKTDDLNRYNKINNSAVES